MKTLTLSSLLLLAGLLAACGGGGGYYDPYGGYHDPYGWYKPGAPVGHLEIQNAPITAAGLPNERVIVQVTFDGKPLDGVTIAPGETFPLPVDPSVDHILTFEFDDGTRASRPDPEAPIRVELGVTTPLVVTR